MTKIDGGLRSAFRQNLPKFMWTSIETGGTGRGIPDSHYLYDGVDGWIEYKQTAMWAVGMRPEQVGWIDRRHRCGGITWIAIRQVRRDGDFLHLVPGSLVKELASGGLRHSAIDGVCHRWEGGPSGWRWSAIHSILTIRGTSRR